jgi:hypothetical protein
MLRKEIFSFFYKICDSPTTGLKGPPQRGMKTEERRAKLEESQGK